jgi:hypothetical protein
MVMVPDQPHRAFTHLVRVPLIHFAHDYILLRLGVSGKPGQFTLLETLLKRSEEQTNRSCTQ